MSLQPIMSMSQTVSVESSTPISVSPSINPVLQAALSSIDVQLEEELTRYRRQKSGRPVTPAYGLGSYQTRKSIDLISLEPIANQTGQTVLNKGTETFLNSATSSQNLPFVTTGQPAQNRIDQSFANASEQLSFDINKTTQTSASQTNTATNTSAHNAQPAQADLMYPSADAVEPDDYLASSEQLLRSLAEEELKAGKQRSFVSNLVNPFSIGLLLLILFSSATVGFILMNPSIISNLGLDKVGKSRTASVAQTPTQTATVPVNPQPVTTATNNQPINTAIPNGPNLASEEFVELNLNTLSGLKTSTGAKTAPVSQPAAPSQTATVPPVSRLNQGGTGNSNLAAAILPPSLQPAPMPPYPQAAQMQVPYPPYGSVQVPVQPQMAPINQYPQTYPQPTQVRIPTTQPKSVYYVLTNNSDRTLKLARKIVANAQTRNFPQGSRIVLGSFNQRPQAQVLVDKLQKQGITAWVYQP